jgi:hypothetical protein
LECGINQNVAKKTILISTPDRLVNKLITFPKPTTPHDLAIFLGPWITNIFVLSIASLYEEAWLRLVNIGIVFFVYAMLSDWAVHCHALYGNMLPRVFDFKEVS